MRSSGESSRTIHDSEDVLHPWSLKLVNQKLNHHDFIQIPVFSLPVPATQWVAGSYIDEFSESHTKDLLVRNSVGVPVPSAGTGTALSRNLVLRNLRRNGGGHLLNPKSLTEDYELGLATPRASHRAHFACCFLRDGRGKRDYIATRAYFPKTMLRAIKQKTRWTIGIAFQGFENVGWSPSFKVNYFLYRDRKGPWANLLVLAGLLTLPFLQEGFGKLEESARLLNLPIEAIVVLAWLNFGFMLNRAFQRVFCTARVYGWRVAAFAPVRIPISNLINAGASFRAFQQFAVHKYTGKLLAWSKTEHELPPEFGEEAA